MTYEATVRVPRELMAVMSAENPTAKSADGVYRFRMPQAIPSYLLALAVGDLAFRPLGDRAGVYAEPAVVERAAWELADTPKMIAAAEKLYGPYRWGRYDVLVLPPSFPFGGMENPRLTFATPTILAGDRSLVALVAHELAHSWSGNLVTNATWNDFWLNEGFTVYFERRIMEALYGRSYSEMLAALGRGDLLETIAELGADSPDTQLKLDLAGRDPDDGVNDVAYEKGYLLLRRIEEVVGRKAFDRFLRHYFERYAFRSMDTESFLALLDRELLAKHPELRAEVRQWVYEPGLPPTAPQPKSDAFAKVEAQAQAFAAGTPAAEPRDAGLVHARVAPLPPHPPRPAPRRAHGRPRPDLQALRQRQLRGPRRLAGEGHRQQLRPGLPGARALPHRHGPPEVPPAALHGAREDPRRRRAGAPHLREGEAGVPHGVAADD